MMEITSFVVSGREKAKLYGDYATYRTQLSNRIHNLRSKLGVATKPRAKYATKAPVSAEDIARSHEFINLLLLTSERAWAHAMSMREIHSADKKGITGSTRSHIISRLNKASGYAQHLFEILAHDNTAGANINDILEARAYVASLIGAKEFEKQSWEACVKSYSEARIIYSALATSTKNDMFKDLLSDPVDPSIRYGAYQMRLPRTVAIPIIARKYFPRSDAALVSQVQKLDPDVLSDQPTRTKAETTDAGSIPKTITWRSRTVDLEDAAIATALASVNAAEKKLSETLAAVTASQAADKASAYDEILIASQDAVDATKHAIDELVGEGVGQGDKRMQSLQITRTAVSYDMVSWRIGRNRVLVGEMDGASAETPALKQSKKKKSAQPVKEEGTGRKLAHLREKAVLYDAILQSLDSIKELPGVAADSIFLTEIDAKYGYFTALKCLTIARSHALLSNPKNALALLARASEKCNGAHSHLTSAMETSTSSPPNITIFPSEAAYLKSLLDGEVQHYRALVELTNLGEASQKANVGSATQPLIERLSEYPLKPVVLENLVAYPPKLEPVPVKPLFFDVAWNYIEYPGREIQEKSVESKESKKNPVSSGTAAEQTAQQKRGWFGFGR